jgi:imidazolonepropionase-like amidohydrolase
MLTAAERRGAPAPSTGPQDKSPRTASADGVNGNGAGNGSHGSGDTPAQAPAPAPAPSAQAAIPMPAALPRGVLAITNARIHPVTRPMIERGTIVIRDGRIESVGAGAVPAGATVIDAAGADVYPGWINGRTSLGLADPGPRGYADTNEMLDFNPHLRTVVAFHNDSEAIPVTRANGVTTAAVVPAGGVLGGQVAVMNLDGYTWEESAVRPSAGVSFQFPALRDGSPGGSRDFETLRRERDEKLNALSRLLAQARAYARATPRGEVDWVLESLLPIANRALPFFTEADHEADIRAAVAFADRENVRLVITGGLDAGRVAPLLKEKNIPVILGPVLTLPRREDESHAASFQVAGDLFRAGVKFAFATADANNARLLPYHAAMAVAWGLPREEAIKALTINAAELLGVADRVGSIEPGRIANLLIAKGDPLEIQTEITNVIIAGRNVNLMNKHLALYERYMARP